MSYELLLLLALPLLAAVPIYALSARQVQALHAGATGAALAVALDIARRLLLVPAATREPPPELFAHYLRVDELGAVMIVLVAAASFIVALVALGRARTRVEGAASGATPARTGPLASGRTKRTQRLRLVVETREPRRLALLSLVFETALLVVVVCDHLGLMWIVLELSALLGALLVGARGGAAAVRAALKYMLLGGAGLVLALLGTALLYRAGGGAFKESDTALSFQWLIANGQEVGKQALVVRLAFACALVGYGAKVGFFPLHVWKADVYSAASPAAAGLLAGAAVAASLCAILRFAAVARAAGDEVFVDSLLRATGLASALAATAFVVAERDIVRILAYTSIEQMGLCAAGFGLGAQGTRAALLQLFGNAVLKALAFGLAGEVARARGHAAVHRGKGIFGTASGLGAAYLIAIFGALGFPPFGLFTSELYLLGAAISEGHPVFASLLALCLMVAFAAVGIAALRAVFERSDASGSPTPLRRNLLLAAAVAFAASILAGQPLLPDTLFDALASAGRGLP